MGGIESCCMRAPVTSVFTCCALPRVDVQALHRRALPFGRALLRKGTTLARCYEW